MLLFRDVTVYEWERPRRFERVFEPGRHRLRKRTTWVRKLDARETTETVDGQGARQTAALRNLANAARLMEGNPALMQLRLLQQLAGSSGNTVVLGFPTSATPPPVTRAGDTELPPIDAGQSSDS